jgi:hypothetical protein
VVMPAEGERTYRLMPGHVQPVEQHTESPIAAARHGR